MKCVTERGYTVIKEMGSGGEGHVYLCENAGKTMILKAVSQLSEEQIDILSRVNNLKSPYFPQIFEVINDAGNTYILREYIEGCILREELTKNGYFSHERAKRIFFELCNALSALHNAKPEPIIHRDLKPENIIITPQGQVRLIDFGIARCYKPDSFRDTVLAGTDGYTAPEVKAGLQSDPRSDIYSLGVLLYEMLCGKNLLEPPFQLRPLRENIPYLPQRLDGVIAKAVGPQQIVRYQTVDEFRKAVEGIREEYHCTNKKPLLYFIYGALASLVLLISSYFLFILNDDLFDRDILARDYTGQDLDEVCGKLLEKNISTAAYSIVTNEYKEGIIVSQTRKGDDSIEFQVCIGPETGSVAFDDPALERVVRDVLGIAPDEPISSESMALLVELDAQSLAIKSLNGLEHAINLTNLQISHNSISDISPVENLGRLTELRFNYNKVSELSCLSRLKNLKILHFENNNILDIGILKGMDLYDLEMGGNSIIDISPISKCKNVVALSIHSNRISDLSPLSEMKNLSRLLAGGNLIADIKVLSGLNSLTYLDVEGNRISDLSSVAVCRKLSFLNCRSNYITDIYPLAELSHLEELVIDRELYETSSDVFQGLTVADVSITYTN